MTLVNTLAQAREALGKGRFDLLLLDVNLPDGSGLELLRQVRGQVPVILLTANDLETDIVTGLESGAEDYITKPFVPVEVLSRIRSQLRRYSRMDSRTEDKETLPSCAGGSGMPGWRLDPSCSILTGWNSGGMGRLWSSARRSRSFCGCWWRTGARPWPGGLW